jgi:hypothetical protein
MSLRRERHYQYIRYLKGGYSLKDINRIMTITSTAAAGRHTKAQDKKELLQLEGAIGRIAMTRQQAVDVMTVKFLPNRAKRREELIGRFFTGYKATLPHDYTREKALQRKPGTKPAKQVNPLRTSYGVRFLETAVNTIKDEYGSVEKYFKTEIRLSSFDITQLRARYTY